MRIVVVAGTRPEFIKLAPVVQELRRRDVHPTIISTGQHTGLLQGTPAETVMVPTFSFNYPSANQPVEYAAHFRKALAEVFHQWGIDLVMVQGDTASAYAGALAASDLEIPVAHVEAGIRSGDLQDPWPEEQFRVEIDKIAQYRYAATWDNRYNLGAKRDPQWDGRIPEESCEITGNPGIDALYSHTQPVAQSQKVDRVLITLHRRESFGEPLKQMIAGIVAAAQRYPNLQFWWPTHPNPRVQEALPNSGPQNMALLPPMETVRFAHMLATSRAVISDSGGIQEECAALGVPIAVARERTDRPESVEIGLAQVAGRTEAGILAGLAWALDAKIEPSAVFGDGKAAPRIVEHLLNGASQ